MIQTKAVTKKISIFSWHIKFSLKDLRSHMAMADVAIIVQTGKNYLKISLNIYSL